MIKSLELWNYKLFDNIKFDLTDNSKNGAKSLAVVYGENGAGKTTLIDSIFTIKELMSTIVNMQRLKDFQKKIRELQESIGSDDEGTNEMFADMAIKTFKNVEAIYEEIKPVNMSDCKVRIRLEFIIDSKRGYYDVVLHDKEIVSEELKYVLNKRITNIITIKNKEYIINKNIFKNNFKEILHDKLEKYWGSHSILAIIRNEFDELSRDYIEDNIEDEFINLMQWFNNIAILTSSSHSERARLSMKYGSLRDITEGKLKEINEFELQGIQKALSIIFSDLYLDIESVSYEFIDDKYKLYFNKLINGNIVSVPHDLESTGTNNILKLFPFIVALMEGDTVLIDEFDSGIHDLLMLNILRDISENMTGQLIVTTHTTLMMDELNKNNIYIFDSTSDGFKEIVPISEYSKIQKNNSIRSMYVRGVLGGIPNTENINFKELINSMGEYIDDQKKKAEL